MPEPNIPAPLDLSAFSNTNGTATSSTGSILSGSPLSALASPLSSRTATPCHSIPSSPKSATHSIPRCRMSRQVKQDVLVEGLPTLIETPAGSARRALFLKKLRLCCYMCESPSSAVLSSSSSSSSAAAASSSSTTTIPPPIDIIKTHNLKRATLLEIVNYLTTCKPVLQIDDYTAIFDMFQMNLFRALPSTSFEALKHNSDSAYHINPLLNFTYSPEDDVQREDPQWAHLQIVYEILLRLVSTNIHNYTSHLNQFPTEDNPYPEPQSSMHQITVSHKILYSTYLSKRFSLCLLANFKSEDPRERDYLKTILHRIYGSSMSLRPFLRKHIMNHLLGIIYQKEDYHGTSELLEILGSIINGFALPLKPAHTEIMLQKILLPLHKVNHLGIFHSQLSYCLLQFLSKDPSLSNMIFTAILKYWPKRNSKKEVLFLAEVEEILMALPQDVLEEREVDVNGNVVVKPIENQLGNPFAPAAPDVTTMMMDESSTSMTTTTSTTSSLLSRSLFLRILHRICQCVESSHFQISEKAVSMLNPEFLGKWIFTGVSAQAAAAVNGNGREIYSPTKERERAKQKAQQQKYQQEEKSNQATPPSATTTLEEKSKLMSPASPRKKSSSELSEERWRCSVLTILAKALITNTELPIFNSLDLAASPHIPTKSPIQSPKLHTRVIMNPSTKVVVENGSNLPSAALAMSSPPPPGQGNGSSSSFQLEPLSVPISPPLASFQHSKDKEKESHRRTASAPLSHSSYRGHWNGSITTLTQETLKMIEDFGESLAPHSSLSSASDGPLSPNSSSSLWREISERVRVQVLEDAQRKRNEDLRKRMKRTSMSVVSAAMTATQAETTAEDYNMDVPVRFTMTSDDDAADELLQQQKQYEEVIDRQQQQQQLPSKTSSESREQQVRTGSGTKISSPASPSHQLMDEKHEPPTVVQQMKPKQMIAWV